MAHAIKICEPLSRLSWVCVGLKALCTQRAVITRERRNACIVPEEQCLIFCSYTGRHSKSTQYIFHISLCVFVGSRPKWVFYPLHFPLFVDG